MEVQNSQVSPWTRFSCKTLHAGHAVSVSAAVLQGTLPMATSQCIIAASPQLLRDAFGAHMRSEGSSVLSNGALYRKKRMQGNQQPRRPVHESRGML